MEGMPVAEEAVGGVGPLLLMLFACCWPSSSEVSAMGAIGISAVERVSGCDLFRDEVVYNTSTQPDEFSRDKLSRPDIGMVCCWRSAVRFQ